MNTNRTFKDYLQKNYKTICLIGVFTIIFCLFRLLCYTISYDTDEWLVSPDSTLTHWLGIGRYSLVFLKCITGKCGNLLLLNILTYIGVFIYSVLFLYFLNINQATSLLVRDLLCGIVIISSPIFLEQYYFTLQSAEVSFAMILTVISFIATYKMLAEKKWLYSVPIILLLVFCFGIYQSFVNLYIVGALICLYKLNTGKKKDNLIRIAVTFGIFFLALVGYILVSNAAIAYFQIETNGYLELVWFSEPFSTALYNVISMIGRVLLGYGNVLNLSYTFCLLFVFYRLSRERFQINWNNFYLIALLISPFLLNVATASLIAIRSLLCFPVLCAFLFWEYYDSGKLLRAGLIVTVLSQIGHSELLLYSDYMRSKNDVAIAKKVYADCHADENTIIVFKGLENTEENTFCFKGQMMGHSYFEWSSDEKNAEEIRVNYFMQIYGMDFALPSEEQLAARDSLNFSSEYPGNGYIQEKEGVYYVNLGEASD